ncbi:putative E3 ubiquitin-protein ligase XERICO [Canna indica]|uniref:E3 ubiquitin-protein ligase XERICO n=1 Tax=Canna indica TaxID=4628 RepID=A0AAQ3Q1Z7_9LILI|nr:putative E3 ubiquitin-protein ligase XERICO [Canna indica]
MGLFSLPASTGSVLTLILVNIVLSVSFLRSVLVFLFRLLRPHPPSEPSLVDRFRSRFDAVARSSTDCRICLVQFELGSVVNRLACGHLFHRSCLETWVDYMRATCPLCRADILEGRGLLN